jgi:hypothetical protein
MEAARQGNHTFYVSETSNASTRFGATIDLPQRPGEGAVVGSEFELTYGVDTAVFRDGGASGSVFTTCVVGDTTSAGRVSQ